MEMTGQFYAWAALVFQTNPLIPIVRKAGLTAEALWKFVEERNLLHLQESIHASSYIQPLVWSL